MGEYRVRDNCRKHKRLTDFPQVLTLRPFALQIINKRTLER